MTKIIHSANPSCGVDLLSRKKTGANEYPLKMVCRRVDVGDIINSFTSSTPNGFIDFLVTEIVEERKPKGSHKEGMVFYEFKTICDIGNLPPELHPQKI